MRQIQIQKKTHRRVGERPAELPDVATGLKLAARMRERLLRELSALLASLDAAIEDAAT